MTRLARAALVAACTTLIAAAPAAAKTGFEVGAAKASITPTDLTNLYLGGYGIGPSHLAQGVLRPIYARAIAIRDRHGNQVVIAALDLQGHFLGYQQGPYGFADIADDVQRRLGIPPSHMILQSIHTHNGPDDLGVWGGVPDSYLAYVKAQTEKAIEDAVAAEQPARVRWGTADMTHFAGTFGSDDDATHTGDNADYPLDNQLRVLQATGADGHVIATLVNFSTHPTIYGPLDKVSPDWPGATADFLEHDERNIPDSTSYGYPGSVALVTVGALGHSWPAGPPAGADPAVDPGPGTDNQAADDYGNAVARMAMAAMQAGRSVGPATVDGAGRSLRVASMNPVLASLILAPVPGFHIMRAYTPPYGAGDVFTTRVTALRVGDLSFFSSPGEAYPTIQKSLASEVHAPVAFVMSLAWDQLGYIEEVSDYNGAFQCSTDDEWFFTISPLFGTQLLRAQRANARELGFQVTRPQVPGDSGPGPIPPSTNCTMQQITGAGLP
jgi:hypothetical protein